MAWSGVGMEYQVEFGMGDGTSYTSALLEAFGGAFGNIVM